MTDRMKADLAGAKAKKKLTHSVECRAERGQAMTDRIKTDLAGVRKPNGTSTDINSVSTGIDMPKTGLFLSKTPSTDTKNDCYSCSD
jgi:hypothetical protein